MHHDEKRVLARVDRALTERITPAVHEDLGPLRVRVWQVPGDGEPIDVQQVPPAEEFTAVQLPYPWGRAWSTWFFRLEGEVPAADGPVLLEADLGFKDDWPGNQCEGLLRDADLVPLKAINSRNRTVPVTAPAGQHVTYLLEAAANPDLFEHGTIPTEIGDRLTAGPELLYSLREARFVTRRPAVWGLLHDLDVLRHLVPELPEHSPRRAHITEALDRAIDAVDLHDVPATASRARAVLAPALAAPAADSALEAITIGHAHIDSAWLWPVRETARKVARTFSNVTALMQEYPELTFTATSAQQYAWLEQDHPEIFARVRAAVAEGRWFPSGGMWVESDAMMPGGEALIRQFTHGIRYFDRVFGQRSRTLWLPDSFGYTAALPQIARQMGLTGFLTQKISWSRTNQLPHSSMWWEGIDGTRILTHFPPVNMYDSMLTADEIAAAERNFREKGRSSLQVIPFGYGDGGGGPTADMLERARRRANLDGSPRLRMGDPDGFFDELRAEYASAAPTYRGELYLEFHRGIFTSQLEMKQGNRRMEAALRTLELVWALVTRQGAGELDVAAVDRLWERTLLLQFHDILPGSSIAWVHREAREDYARMLEQAEAITDEGLALLGTGTAPRVLNPGGHRRRGIVETAEGPQLVEVPGSALAPLAQVRCEPRQEVRAEQHADGTITLDNGQLSVHIAADGTLDAVRDLTAGRELLPAGARANELQMFQDVPNEFDAWDVDRHYRGARQDRVGEPTQLRLVEASELRASVEIRRRLGDSETIQHVTLEADARRVDLRLEVDWGERETLVKAAFPLAIAATEHRAEIQFGHLARPFHENTSWEFARFELPMQRWVLAAEPGYGAALLTDGGYGYDALPGRSAPSETEEPGELGTGWPGTEAGAQVMLRLSLLRSPNWPDPRADRSRRTIRYALLADADPVSAVHAAEAMHLPLRLVESKAGTEAEAAVGAVRDAGAAGDPGAAREEGAVSAGILQAAWIEDPGVHVDAVLPARDGSGDMVLRLHEGHGGHVDTHLHLGMPAERVREVSPLEEDLEDPQIDVRAVPGEGEPLPAEDGEQRSAKQRSGELHPAEQVQSIPLRLRPFQILTLRLTRPADRHNPEDPS